MQTYLQQIEKPNVIEIGVDTGATLIPLVQFLSRTKNQFNFDAVDVLLQEPLAIMLKNLLLQQDSQRVLFTIQNSLEYLKTTAVENKREYHLALVDGDHNYYTVSNELELLHPMMSESSIIICDDYHGRWSERDLFYSTRVGYENNPIATKPVIMEKQGVKLAVDDFLNTHQDWKMIQVKGEPVVLIRGNVKLEVMNEDSPE